MFSNLGALDRKNDFNSSLLELLISKKLFVF